MLEDHERHMSELRRLLVWIVVAAVATVVAALGYLSATGELTTAMVLATIFGVFVSVVLGGGLMAAMFFSNKSGHDRGMTDATRQDDKQKGA